MLLLEALNVVFLMPRINLWVKEFSVGVSLLEVCNAGRLLLPTTFDDRHAQYSMLEIGSQLGLPRGEVCILLRYIQAKNDI